jgi:hypothetical protein
MLGVLLVSCCCSVKVSGGTSVRIQHVRSTTMQVAHILVANPHPLFIKGPPHSSYAKTFVLKYGSWEAPDGCKILPWGVGTICPPGKHHSDNFPMSPKMESNLYQQGVY